MRRGARVKRSGRASRPTVAAAHPAGQGLATEAEVADRVRRRHRGGSVVFGAPCRCPECGRFAVVAGVDDRAGVARYRCDCGTRFALTRRALAATSPSGPVEPVRGGVLIEALFAAP